MSLLLLPGDAREAGEAGGLCKALKPQIVVLDVPSEDLIFYHTSVETSIVTKPSAWGKVATGVAYGTLGEGVHVVFPVQSSTVKM